MKIQTCLATWTSNIQLASSPKRVRYLQKSREGLLHGHKMKGVGEVCARFKKHTS